MKIENLPIKLVDNSSHHLACEILFESSSGLFEGHFPDLPILAGVLQVHFVMQLFETHTDHRLVFKGIKRIKFLEPIFADSIVNLECRLEPADPILHESPHQVEELQFVYFQAARKLSLGTIVVGHV